MGPKRGVTTRSAARAWSFDGQPVNSVLVPGAQAAGRKVQIIEGLASAGRLHSFAGGFLEEGGVQCGILYAGDADERKVASGSQAAPDRGRNQAISGGQPMSLHRLCRDRAVMKAAIRRPLGDARST